MKEERNRAALKEKIEYKRGEEEKGFERGALI